MDLSSIIESILFVHGEPLSLEKLAKITGAKLEDVTEALHRLEEEYKTRGLVILEKDSAWQLGTNPAAAEYLETLAKSEFTEELSRAGLDTIAIIAYKGPLTRAKIEYVRGVNSSFTLRNLLMRGLIERIENPQDARSYLYRISFDFMKHLGVTRPEELPRYKEFREEHMDVAEGAITP